jgi:hypothetical protein
MGPRETEEGKFLGIIEYPIQLKNPPKRRNPCFRREKAVQERKRKAI